MSGILLSLAAAVLGAGGAFGLYRRARQQRNARALSIDPAAGIDESRFVSVGGIEQWISIRGAKRDNPVLLVLHGGPATSYMSFTPMFRAWEEHFTVVQWDRRGVGKTFGRNGSRGSGELTLERIASDGCAVAEYLCKYLHQDKVFLLGHSMGSMIGITMAARRPDVFHAYIGTEQVIEMSSNERLSYDMILARARSVPEERTVRQLERLGPPPYRNPRQWGIKQQAAEKVDVAYGRIVSGMMGMMLYSPAYAIRDLFNLLAGAHFCIQKLYTQWMTFDARKLGMVFHTPIFIKGDSDVMTPTALAATWLAEIEAPQKALVSIEEGGHLVFVTAAATYLAELLTRIRPLAVVSSGTQCSV